MPRGRAIGYEQLSVKAKSWELVANALLGFGRNGFNRPPKLFQRGSFVITHLCQIIVMAFGPI